MEIALWGLAIAIGLFALATHRLLDSQQEVARRLDRLSDIVERATAALEQVTPSDPIDSETVEERDTRWTRYRSDSK